jgi:hypothetical protein
MRETFRCEPRVENMSTQERFLLLVGPEPGVQAGTKRCLESMHDGRGEGSTAVMLGTFPIRLAQEPGAFDATVSFERAGFEAKDGTRSWM